MSSRLGEVQGSRALLWIGLDAVGKRGDFVIGILMPCFLPEGGWHEARLHGRLASRCRHSWQPAEGAVGHCGLD